MLAANSFEQARILIDRGAISDGTNNALPAETKALVADGVRFVKIDILTNYGATDRVGLF